MHLIVNIQGYSSFKSIKAQNNTIPCKSINIGIKYYISKEIDRLIRSKLKILHFQGNTSFNSIKAQNITIIDKSINYGIKYNIS